MTLLLALLVVSVICVLLWQRRPEHEYLEPRDSKEKVINTAWLVQALKGNLE